MPPPPKPPISPVRWRPPPVEPLPDFPGIGAQDLTIVPVPGHAPEDVVVDPEGRLWTGVDDGRIVCISPGGAATVVANTGGRPLGLAVAADGRLLICDSPHGLLAMDRATGALTTLVDTVIDAGGPRHLQFTSNVIELPDGTIYFTESTSALTYAHFTGAVLEARGRGSLFRRDPDGTVSIVADGLYFANGVAPTLDGTALVVAETLGRRISKYWLSGPRAGSLTPLAVNLPGYPDNMSTGSDGRIWVALVTSVNRTAEWLAPRAPVLRKVVWRLPERLTPTLAPSVWAVAFDPDTGEATAGLRTRHPRFSQVTGVVEVDGRLWMGSIGAAAVAHCALP